jgi:rubrerythrin
MSEQMLAPDQLNRQAPSRQEAQTGQAKGKYRQGPRPEHRRTHISLGEIDKISNAIKKVKAKTNSSNPSNVDLELKKVKSKTDKKLELIIKWLGIAHPSKWHEVIFKDEKGWVSCFRSYEITSFAKQVAAAKKIFGIRPEKLIRSITIDIDKKQKAVSQYWEKYGESKELLALKRSAELIGCRVSILRSSESGGLHVYIALPERIHSWLAYWLSEWLLGSAGMTRKGGQAEVFPSRIDYSTNGSRSRSNGFRLPGQKGSALIRGHKFIEDTIQIYQQLLDDLDNTQICSEWKTAIAEADQLYRISKKGFTAFKKSSKFSSIELKWTGESQSHDILLALTTKVRLRNRSVTHSEILASLIYQEAIALEGYEEHASKETKRDLPAWSRRLANSSLSKEFLGSEAVIKDKNSLGKQHNINLFNKTRATLAKLKAKYKQVKDFSQRKVAWLSGLNRRTVQKHWHYWVSPLVHTPLNNGVPTTATMGGRLDLPVTSTNQSKKPSKYDERFIYIDELSCFVENILLSCEQSLSTSNFYVQAMAPP